MSAKAARARRGLPPVPAAIPVPSDKRFRRSEVRQGGRRNWRRLLLRSGWIAGLVLVSLGFLAWVGGLVVNSSMLRISTIAISDKGRLTPAEVETWLGGLKGQPLLRVDLEKFKTQLLACPWVASAELWRVLPSTVRVHVVERTPLAIARFSGELFLVDGAGVILDRFGPRYRDLDLPIVDGLGSSAAVGETVDSARVQLVERLLHDLAPRPDLLDRLSQVDVSSPRNAIVTLRGEAAALYLGDEGFLERLERWSQTASSVREHLEIDDHVDLRYGPVVYGK